MAYLNTPMDSQYYCPPGSASNELSAVRPATLQPMDRVESSVGMEQRSTLGAPCDNRTVAARRMGTLCAVTVDRLPE